MAIRFSVKKIVFANVRLVKGADDNDFVGFTFLYRCNNEIFSPGVKLVLSKQRQTIAPSKFSRVSTV